MYHTIHSDISHLFCYKIFAHFRFWEKNNVGLLKKSHRLFLVFWTRYLLLVRRLKSKIGVGSICSMGSHKAAWHPSTCSASGKIAKVWPWVTETHALSPFSRDELWQRKRAETTHADCVHTSLLRIVFNEVPLQEAVSPDHTVQPIFCSRTEEVSHKQLRKALL